MKTVTNEFLVEVTPGHYQLYGHPTTPTYMISFAHEAMRKIYTAAEPGKHRLTVTYRIGALMAMLDLEKI